jgi:hypothetical protein
MAKYVNTKDDSLGAKVLDNGTAIVARLIDGRKHVEIIEDLKEVEKIIGDVLPIAEKIWQMLVEFFNSVFNKFPTIIKIGGEEYIFTEQRSPGKGIDRVFYMNALDRGDALQFMHENQRIGKARRALRDELKELGIIS